MNYLVILAEISGALIISGLVFAIFGERKDESDEPEELPRVVVTQQVPSVFDTLRGKRK